MTGAGLAERVQQAPRIVEAAALLAATRLVLALSPRVGAARLLGRAGREPADALVPASSKAGAVARAVERAAPWIAGSTCLNRALTGWLMLQRRGISSVVRVGARREQAGSMSMHAWLEVGGEPLIGSEEAPAFVPLSR